jgi:hypothetical protein
LGYFGATRATSVGRARLSGSHYSVLYIVSVQDRPSFPLEPARADCTIRFVFVSSCPCSLEPARADCTIWTSSVFSPYGSLRTRSLTAALSLAGPVSCPDQPILPRSTYCVQLPISGPDHHILPRASNWRGIARIQRTKWSGGRGLAQIRRTRRSSWRGLARVRRS